MRVAFIVEKFPNVSETFILDEIVGALRRGIEVDIYAFRRGTSDDVHPAYTEFGLASRTFYCAPDISSRTMRLFAALPETLEMLLRKPFAFVKCAFERKRGIQSRTFISLARALVKARKRYDVVHAHFGPNGIRAEVVRRARVFDAPVITTFHGYDATSFVKQHGTASYTDLARNGERFIAVSHSIARAMRNAGFAEDRTIVMPLGVNVRDFEISPVSEQRDVIRVLSIGRFVEKKGLEFGIRAVAAARQRGVQLLYEIVGDGELGVELKAIVTELNATDFVVFHGWKNQLEVGALLANTDIMLVPSVTAADGDQEGLPVVVKEAMSRALPVVGSRHAGIPEIVVHGETGLLAAERDFATLAEHLIALAGNAAERMRLGYAGRSVIEMSYDNEKLVDDLVELYKSVASTYAVHGV